MFDLVPLDEDSTYVGNLQPDREHLRRLMRFMALFSPVVVASIPEAGTQRPISRRFTPLPFEPME